MRSRRVAALAGLLAVMLLPLATSGRERLIKMSTTTSMQASGLLDVLLPAFTQETGIGIKVFAKETEGAIREGMDGNVDLIFVHAKGREEKFVAEGFGTKRFAVMHNDFVILGPSADPAGIKGMTDAAAALKKIALAEATFVSRGDDSATHTKEQALWKVTGLQMMVNKKTFVKKGKETEFSFTHPVGLGEWYLATGQGMGKTLTFADEKGAYTLADRSTYIKYKFGRKEGLGLEVLCKDDPLSITPYGVIPVNPKKHPHVNLDLANEFAYWLVSPKGQGLIAGYKPLGIQLFHPDAIPVPE